MGVIATFFGAALLSAVASSEPLCLMDFETVEDVSAFRPGPGVKVELAEEHATRGRCSMKITFPPYEAGKPMWPAATVRFEPPSDWSAYRFLTVDVFNPHDEQAEIGVNIAGNVQYFSIPGGKGETISVAADRSKVDALSLLMRLGVSRPARSTTFYVDNVLLHPKSVRDASAFTLAIPPPVLKGGRIPASVPVADFPLRFMADLPEDVRRGLRLVIRLGDFAKTIPLDNVETELRVPTPPGDDVLSVEVLDADGKAVWSREQTLTRLPKSPDEVALDERGICRVNGSPLFPIGIFNPVLEDYGLYKSMGFNCIGPYIRATDEGVIESARRLGLRVLSDAGAKVHLRLFGSERLADIAEFVARAKGSDVLLGYYLFDEPSPSEVPRDVLEACVLAACSADPYHLATGCNNRFQEVYAGTADVMIVDGYPIPKNTRYVVDRLRHTKNSLRGRGTWWLAPQCFGWEAYCMAGDDAPKDETGRAPTYEELRAQCWAGIALGAKGVIFYSARIQGFQSRFAWPVTWKALEATILELAALQDVILAPEIEVDTNDHMTMAMARKWNGGVFLALTNFNDEQRTVAVTGLPEGDYSPLDGGDRPSFVGGALRAVLPGRASRLYATVPPGVPLPDIVSTRDRMNALETERRRVRDLDFARHEAGATIETSWGLPKDLPEFVWRRAIDGYRGTSWSLADAGWTLSRQGFKWPDTAFRGERWIEVRLAGPRTVESVVVVSANLQFELLTGAGDELSAVPVDISRSREYDAQEVDVATVRFDTPRPIDRIRLRLTRDAQPQKPELLFEIEANAAAH